MSCPLECYPGNVADFLDQTLKNLALDPLEKGQALDKDKMTQQAEEFVNTATEGIIMIGSQDDDGNADDKATKY